MNEKTSWKIKYSVIAVIIFAIAMLIILKTTTEISMLVPSIVVGIIIIFSLVALFGKSIAEKMKLIKKEETPQPISEEKITEWINKKVLELPNYIKINTPIIHETETVNNNTIYRSLVRLKYTDEILGDSCYFIINATYPNTHPSILRGDTPEEVIREKMNAKAQSPEKINREVIETKADEFGRPSQRIIKEVHQEEKDEKESVA